MKNKMEKELSISQTLYLEKIRDAKLKIALSLIGCVHPPKNIPSVAEVIWQWVNK